MSLADGALLLGALLASSAYIWAFILASRVSGAWLLGMLFCGAVAYPVLAYRHWPKMRKNAITLLSGLFLMTVSALLRS